MFNFDYQKDFGISANLRKCPTCGNPLTSREQIQHHHKLSQSSVNLELYGDLIHSPLNIQIACWNCHPGHNHPNLIYWTELQFCEALNIKPRSKQYGGKIG